MAHADVVERLEAALARPGCAAIQASTRRVEVGLLAAPSAAPRPSAPGAAVEVVAQRRARERPPAVVARQGSGCWSRSQCSSSRLPSRKCTAATSSTSRPSSVRATSTMSKIANIARQRRDAHRQLARHAGLASSLALRASQWRVVGAEQPRGSSRYSVAAPGAKHSTVAAMSQRRGAGCAAASACRARSGAGPPAASAIWVPAATWLSSASISAPQRAHAKTSRAMRVGARDVRGRRAGLLVQPEARR